MMKEQDSGDVDWLREENAALLDRAEAAEAEAKRQREALENIIRLADSIDPNSSLLAPYRQEVVLAARAALRGEGGA